MRLHEIQSNLLTIVRSVTELAAVQSQVVIDDGNKAIESENALTDKGISLLIMAPECLGVNSQGQGATSLVYASTVWVRTNPKVTVNGAAKWDPCLIESKIIPKVLQFGSEPINFFQIPDGLEPEVDWTDVGLNSRLIRFATTIILQ